MAVLPLTSSSLDLTISIPGHSSGEGGGEDRAMRNLDINQIPVEEEKHRDDWNSNGERGGGGGASGSGSSPPRKKLRLSKEQSRQLEESFRRNQTLNHRQKEDLATHLKLKARQVEVWFQNRRARSKLKQTEMECDYLKRWFASLTERNRRLQKEVEQLRAMKAVGSSSAMLSTAQSPASTFTMCPCCERVADTSQQTTTTSSAHVASAAATLPERSKLLPATRQPSSAAC